MRGERIKKMRAHHITHIRKSKLTIFSVAQRKGKQIKQEQADSHACLGQGPRAIGSADENGKDAP